VDVVIYHNPECGTSRNVLAIIEAAGYTPTVIEYLKRGWTKPQLLGLFAAPGLTPRTALRETKSPATKLGLLDEGVTNDAILDAYL
jgi:arsenate reductase